MATVAKTTRKEAVAQIRYAMVFSARPEMAGRPNRLCEKCAAVVSCPPDEVKRHRKPCRGKLVTFRTAPIGVLRRAAEISQAWMGLGEEDRGFDGVGLA